MKKKNSKHLNENNFFSRNNHHLQKASYLIWKRSLEKLARCGIFTLQVNDPTFLRRFFVENFCLTLPLPPLIVPYCSDKNYAGHSRERKTKNKERQSEWVSEWDTNIEKDRTNRR